MPSSTSNFKRRLRLPRLFFRKPSQLESVHGGPPLEYERPIPPVTWRGITVVVVLIVIAATCAWEFYCRSIGYGPTLNDNEDLWTMARRRVKPESVVIIGDSRAWYDLDLDELEKGLGKRPVQLAMGGSCAYPALAELANDENFHGTIICSIVPRLFVAPLEELLKRLPIPNRPYAQVPPRLPPYFGTLDRERRSRMIEECARPESELQRRIQQIWLPLFTPPPPPTYIPKEEFGKKMGAAIEARFHDVAAAVQKLRARGGKIVFVRFPHSGELKKLEDRETPRAGIWDRVIKETGAPGIYYEDYPELRGFNCPEWSHLSAGDSVEFSKRLVPHLRKALQM